MSLPIFTFPRYFLKLCLLPGLFLIVFAASPAKSCAKIVINEVMWAGSDLSTADEWVEIANIDTENLGSVNISGWKLNYINSSGVETTIVTFAANTFIGSGQYLLVSNFNEANSRLVVSPTVVTTAVSLLNTNLLLRLRDASGAIMDEVDDGIGVPFAGSTTLKASMERRDAFVAGTIKENWATAVTSRGFDAGFSILGTPGFPNAAVPVSTDSVPSTNVTKASTKKCRYYYGSGVIVSEILPSPKGSDEDEEWIEIRNITDKRIDLCGWTLDDSEKGSRPFPLDDWQIDPKATLLLKRPQTHISLNNDVDSVRLIDPTKVVRFELPYEKAKENLSYSRRDDGLYLWTALLTPGQSNEFPGAARRFPLGTVAVSAVMPNPDGSDTENEWVELINTSSEPILLNGWKLRSNAGNTWVIDHLRLRPGEKGRITAEKLPWPLGNDGGSVSLLDSDGYLVSLLEWEIATEGVVVIPENPKRVAGRIVEIHPDRMDVALFKNGMFEQEAVSIFPAGISHNDNLVNILNGALMENKNIELEFDSYCHGEPACRPKPWRRLVEPCPKTLIQGRHAYIFLSSGESLEHLLLRSGEVTVDTSASFTHKEEFLAYESEARSAKLGLWSDADFERRILAKREDEKKLAILESEGLQIVLDPIPGLLARGSGITLETNMPADISVSINDGALVALSGALKMEGSVMNIGAFATVTIGSGLDAVTFSTEKSASFIARKKFYEKSIVISEVFPFSPLSKSTDSREGPTSEWIELWNPTKKDIYLAGWSIDDLQDGGSTPKVLSSDLVLKAGSFLTLSSDQTKLALNDSGDDVHLVSPDGKVDIHTSYGKMKKGQAIGLGNQQCISDVPTPNATNLCITFLDEKIAPDLDHDFLPDDREQYMYHTAIGNPDTDGDGWLDGFEVASGLDPLTSNGTNRLIMASYRDFVVKRFRPKMYAYKTKGLTLKAKNYPTKNIRIFLAARETQKQIRIDDAESYEAVVLDRLPPGHHSFMLALTDILGREVFVDTAFAFDLDQSYVYPPPKKPKKPRKSKKPKNKISSESLVSSVPSDSSTSSVPSESGPLQSSLIGSLLRRSKETSGLTIPVNREEGTIVGVILLFWLIMGAVFYVWWRGRF